MAFPDSFVNITGNIDFSASGMSATKLNKDWADMYRTGLRDVGYELSGVISGGRAAASATHATSAVQATSAAIATSAFISIDETATSATIATSAIAATSAVQATSAVVSPSAVVSTSANVATESDTVDGSHASAFALASHGHSHTALSDIGTNAHSVIDTFIASKAAASGLASLDASSLVVQNPASASATPGAGVIPIAGGAGTIAAGFIPDNFLSNAGDTGTGDYTFNTAGGLPYVRLSTVAESGILTVVERNPTSTIRGLGVYQNNDGVHAPTFQFRKGRGSYEAPTAVGSGDYAGIFQFFGYQNGGYQRDGQFGFIVNGTPSGTNVPMDFVFTTGISSGIAYECRLTALGSFYVGRLAALATNATDGFLYIPTSAGAPTGTPTAYTGKVALQFDVTNNNLYVYDGGWLKVAMAA